MRFLTVVLLAALAAGIGWGVIFGPYYIDAWKMEEVAGSAAASWAAYNEEKGRYQLIDEMKRREIPEYLTPDKCNFYEDADQSKIVDCNWYVDVYPPLVEPRRLKFHVTRAAGPDGRLVEP